MEESVKLDNQVFNRGTRPVTTY